MSTSTNLPAGFSITSIDGQRCTAVPRASTTLTGADATAAAAFTTSTTSSIDVQPNVPGGVPSFSAAAAAASSVASPTSIAASTSSTAVIKTLSSATTASVTSASALPASKGTTPTTSSSTAANIVAQSDLHATSTTVSGNNNSNGLHEPSKTVLNSSPASTSDQPVSQAPAGVSSKPRLTAAPVVGGVLGAIGLIAVLSLLFWAFRRRKRVGRESLLTPLTTSGRSQYYSDNSSVGPTGRGKKWKAGFGYQTDKVRSVLAGIGAGLAGIGASLKSKVAGDRNDTPSVNLNRGNSQFLDGPIPQHSRNNSVLSNSAGNLSVKDRFTDWWERLGESISFKWHLQRDTKELADPFAAARGMTEKQVDTTNIPDFSQLLSTSDRDLQLRAERRRASMSGTGSVPQIGSLGLDLSIDDPFADPVKASSQTWKPANSANPFADPKTGSNPFADPTRPERSIPKATTYIADIRRSRGQSVDATSKGHHAAASMYRPPSTAVGSLYPSSIAPSRDSYRDTVFSSFSANARKGKGRSDPFDLERPELWRPRKDTDSAATYPNPLNTANLPRVSRPGNAYNLQRQQSVRVVSTATYSSKYSSGVSSLGDWGEPGPDLGPGSASSSLRANANSYGGSTDFSANAGKESFQGNMNKMRQEWDERREKDNVSPQSVESEASSKGGVGKAL